MANLTSEQQTFIVQQIALFRKYTEIQTELKKDFEVELTLQQIGNYDPSKPYYKGAKKWRTLFEKTRAEFLSNVSNIPIANQAYRLRVLQDRLDAQLGNAPNMQNNSLILEIIEKAAKEAGGMFTNRRELTGAGGKDLLPEQLAVIVYKDLLEAKWKPEEAAAWVADHYKVDKEKILNAE